MTPICLERNILKTAGDALTTIANLLWIVCCGAARSAILAIAWLLVVLERVGSLVHGDYSMLEVQKWRQPVKYRYCAPDLISIGSLENFKHALYLLNDSAYIGLQFGKNSAQYIGS